MLALMWDKLVVVRSMQPLVEEHSDSETHTGYPEQINRTAHHPSIGAVISKLRGSTNADVPPFVSLRGMGMGTEPGFLGVGHRPYTAEGPGIQNLRLASGTTQERMEDRKNL